MAKIQHTFPKNKFVAVLWHDPHSLPATEVVSGEDVHNLHRSLPMITNGYILKEDEEGISVASEYCGENAFRNTTYVMKELIVDVIPWPKLKKKKAPKKEPSEMEGADGVEPSLSGSKPRVLP